MSDTPSGLIEIVTVFHNQQNKALTTELVDTLNYAEPGMKVHAVDNTKTNRGFAKACNLGAAWCKAPIIGFLNPDVQVVSPFSGRVVAAFKDASLAIAGNGYSKPQRECRIWRINTFICGACLFVDRAWFESVDGFDERFVWSHEETDLIRRAEKEGRGVRELQLPILHIPQGGESEVDKKYKRHHFHRGARLYREKWKDPGS